MLSRHLWLQRLVALQPMAEELDKKKIILRNLKKRQCKKMKSGKYSTNYSSLAESVLFAEYNSSS